MNIKLLRLLRFSLVLLFAVSFGLSRRLFPVSDDFGGEYLTGILIMF